MVKGLFALHIFADWALFAFGIMSVFVLLSLVLFAIVLKFCL